MDEFESQMDRKAIVDFWFGRMVRSDIGQGSREEEEYIEGPCRPRRDTCFELNFGDLRDAVCYGHTLVRCSELSSVVDLFRTGERKLKYGAAY